MNESVSPYNRFFNSLPIVLILFGCLACDLSTGRYARNIFTKTIYPSNKSEKLRTATFGGGSFWSIEEIFEEVKGVESVISGYSGGEEENPTFKQVQYGNTSHAQCVQIFYNPEIVTYKDLLDIFFLAAHDPTQLNKQGPDEGEQFRSVIFYRTEAEKRLIASKIHLIDESNTFSKPVVTRVKQFENFYPADEEQQDFCARNPDNLYIKGVALPRVKSFRQKFKQYLKPQYE